MRVDNCQPGQGLKVAGVTREQREAVRKGRGGDNGIGQLDAVLLAQADGVPCDRLIERKFGAAANELTQRRFFGSAAGLNEQFDAVDNRQVAVPGIDLLHQLPHTGGREAAVLKVDNNVGVD